MEAGMEAGTEAGTEAETEAHWHSAPGPTAAPWEHFSWTSGSPTILPVGAKGSPTLPLALLGVQAI